MFTSFWHKVSWNHKIYICKTATINFRTNKIAFFFIFYMAIWFRDLNSDHKQPQGWLENDIKMLLSEINVSNCTQKLWSRLQPLCNYMRSSFSSRWYKSFRNAGWGRWGLKVMVSGCQGSGGLSPSCSRQAWVAKNIQLQTLDTHLVLRQIQLQL